MKLCIAKCDDTTYKTTKKFSCYNYLKITCVHQEDQRRFVISWSSTLTIIIKSMIPQRALLNLKTDLSRDCYSKIYLLYHYEEENTGYGCFLETQ